MINWKWESFEDYLKSNLFSFSDPGPLHAPIREFTLKRDDNLRSVLETFATQNAKSNAVNYPAGTVQINTDTATLSDPMGSTVTLTAIQLRNYNRSLNPDPALGGMHEISFVHSVEGQTKNKNEVKYVIDWLANVETAFSWPDATENEIETTTKLKIGSGDHAQTLTHTGRMGGGFSSNCVKINIEGHDVFLSTAKPETAVKVRKPGFILYVGNPSEELREKIRHSLAFSLGIYLVHLGHSTFCQDCRLISFKAITAYSLGGRAFEISPIPPAPLGAGEWDITPQVLSQMVNSICSHYDELNFRSLSWAYWHAVSATPHIAAVHYGAAVEALQREYVKHNRATYNTALLCQGHWSLLKRAAEAVVATMPVSHQTKVMLKNKISGLNSKPQSVLLEEVLSNLGITLSEVEKAAWKHRHNAGHGNYTKPDDSVRLIRETKLLKLRFNRMLLAITNASNSYYDYYTIGQPIRNLSDPIP